MKLAVLITFYNSSLSDSTALQSLLNADLNTLQNIQLFLWNNGPEPLSDSDILETQQKLTTKNIPAILYNTTKNYSLAKVFNHFISHQEFTHYLIFDQDSRFAPDFFINLERAKQGDLILPIIFEEQANDYLWPREVIRRSHTIPIMEMGLCTKRNLEFPNSGTCLSHNFINAFRQQLPYVFNEAFGIYGVDVCFYTDTAALLSENSELKVVIANTMCHRLSQFNTGPDAISATRSVERIYERCLLRLYTHKKSFRSALSYLIRQYHHELSMAECLLYLKCLWLRRHPRNTKQLNEQFKRATQCPIILTPIKPIQQNLSCKGNA